MVGGAGTIGAGLLANGLTLPAFAEERGRDKERSGGLTGGDVDILRFLAAVETIETDLWQQYKELGGIQDSEVPGGSGSKPYINGLIEGRDETGVRRKGDVVGFFITKVTPLNLHLE